ncbi:MAG: hypothetical protein PHO67_08235 [Candidatus Omnitrophica bacterium]|nr:hypothetical protein [Candidatus Omnitrophota bacterium]
MKAGTVIARGIVTALFIMLYATMFWAGPILVGWYSDKWWLAVLISHCVLAIMIALTAGLNTLWKATKW